MTLAPASAAPDAPPPLGRVARRVWLGVLIAGLAVLLGCAIVQALGRDVLRPGPVLRTASVAALMPAFGTLGLFAAAVICRRQVAGFMVAAMTLLAVAMIGWMATVWQGLTSGAAPPAAWSVKTLVSCTAVGGVMAMVGYLLTGPAGPRPVRITRWILVISMVVFTFSLLALLWSGWWQRHLEVPAGGVVLAGLVTVLSGLTLTIQTRYLAAARKRRPESLPRRLAMTVECPRCGHEERRVSGISRCTGCELALIVEIEEPRCECGYLLYRLQGDHCPECGRGIEEADRWLVGER